MKRKVLIIVENASVPRDTRVWKEALVLSRSGYQVSVLCPRGEGLEKTGCEVIQGIRIYRYPVLSEGRRFLSYFVEYGYALFWQFLYSWWIYFRRGFQVIQGCNPPDTIFLVALPFKALGVAYIFDHHDANPELYVSKFQKQGALYKLLALLEKLTFRFSDVVIATNQSYVDLATGRGRVNREDVFVVRNGPDLATFRPVAPNAALKRGKAFLVGYVGTMNFQDGLDILIDVAAHTRSLGRRDVDFTCVGGGPELAGLKRAVSERGLDDVIHFTGRIPDAELLEILSTADVCVNPDRPCEMNNISTMIKIMEYMALGKPIVQFESKEGRFSAQGSSLYADPQNAIPDFAAKVLWLLDHPDERRAMGQLGMRRVQDELSWEHSAEHLLSAYRSAFGKSRRFRPSDEAAFLAQESDRRQIKTEASPADKVVNAGD